MKKIISGRTILLNTRLNTTFIASELDEKIQIRESDNGKIEWAGELDVAVCPHQYQAVAENLWKLLDDIDTASDMFKPSDSNGINSYHNFYSYVMEKQKDRWQYITMDKEDQNKLILNPESY